MSKNLSGSQEFSRGWQIILAASIGIGLGLSPVPFYTIGMFAPELAAEFGWGFGDIMTGITVMTLSVFISGPIVGALADRYGVRKVILVSIVLFSLAFATFALGNGSLVMFYFSWGLIAAVGAGTLPITYTRGVNLWFEEKKGLALGLSLVGTGVFGALIKPLTAWLIADFGWRIAYVAIAALPVLIALPVAWLLFYEHPKEKMNLKTKDKSVSKVIPKDPGMSLNEVLKDRRFWTICIAIIPISFALGGPIPNMENLLLNKGFSKAEIASIVPLIGISVLIGRMVGGWLIDKFWAPGVAFVILSLPSIACWILASGDLTPMIAMISIFLIGFASGVEYDLLAFLIARYFGMKAYSAVYGFIYAAFVLGAGSSPMIFGMMYDKYNNYDLVLIFSLFGLLSGAFLLLSLGKYRVFTHQNKSPIDIKENEALVSETKA